MGRHHDTDGQRKETLPNTKYTEKKKHGADLLALSKAAILMCTQGKVVLSEASTIDILQLMQQLTCSLAARRHVAVETVVDDHRLGDRKLILLA